MAGPELLARYLGGWAMICGSNADTVATMIAGAHPDIRFSDVNSPNVHHGHEGIRTICALASQGYPGAVIAYDDLLFDGRRWSIRWTLTGRRADGTPISRRGASAGSVADDGRVIEHCDYWSRADTNVPTQGGESEKERAHG
jgi:hypothetical protein